MARKLIILSAPSGAGKTTLVRAALELSSALTFSISATTRPQRPHEVDGRDYHFLREEDFRRRIDAGGFLEWEEVYPGRFYGTPAEELDRIAALGRYPILDVDAYGGLNIKRAYGGEALAVFLLPPSVAALRARLERRGADGPAEIAMRLAKAEQEMSRAPEFDFVLVNDSLSETIVKLMSVIYAFLRV